MIIPKPFVFNKVIYSAKIFPKENRVELFINNPDKQVKPQTLYKYYRVNNCAYKHSVDAFLNHYLFSSHPLNLNDKFDCAADLIDYTNLDIGAFIDKLSKELKILSEEKVKTIYNSNDRKPLCNMLSDLYQMILYLKFGVISLSKIPDDILMWSYYAENSGFVLKLNTELLYKTELLNKTESLSNQVFGPFPINYSDNLEKIDNSNYDNTICTIYQSNVKFKKWESENEWRYLTFNPYGKYHPSYACSKSDVETRKFTYEPDSLEEVILGYDFFNINEIDFNKRTPEYDIMNIPNDSIPENWKINFLNYIVDNSIKCSQIVKYRNSFLLKIFDIKIERLTNYQFKIFNPFKNSLYI